MNRTNPPVIHARQQQSNYCWAACIKMILSVKKPNLQNINQESIVQRLIYDKDNFAAYDFMIKTGLENYGIAYSEIQGSLLWDDVQTQIDNNNPIIAGLTWSQGGGHAVVISGWEHSNNIKWVHINDPEMPDGQKISYDSLVKGNYQPGIHRGENHKWDSSLIFSGND